MKKILLLIPVLFCLVACNRAPDNLVALSDDAVNGVVQIINSPIDPPKVSPSGPDRDSDEGEKESIGTALGSGFIIKPNVIVTNYHVVSGDNRKFEIVGHNDMKHYTASVIAKSPESDIAVLKIDQWDEFVANVHPPVLHWGDSGEIHQGQPVWALGHPYGMSWSLTDGIVSSTLRRTPDGKYFIQTNTSINPGNSGGPLFTRDGKIIGINTEIFGDKGFIGLSIPSDYAKKVVNDLLDGGVVKQGMIGIIMKPSADQHGVAVGALMLGSNSIDAGLLPNDVLLQIKTPVTDGWVKVYQPEDMQYQTKLLHSGDLVELYVRRDSTRYLTVKFTMADPKNLKENH